MVWGVLLLLLFVAPSSFALNECPALLSTSFGWGGALTASLDGRGKFHFWRDGFDQNGLVREPRVSRSERDVHLSSLGTLRGFAGQGTTAADQGLFVAVDVKGALDILTPGASVLPILLPDAVSVSAAALYRLPARWHEREWLPTDRLHSPDRPSLGRGGRDVWQMASFRARFSPVDLFVASGRDVWRIQFHFREVEDEDDDLKLALLNRIVKVTEIKPERPDEVVRREISTSDIPILDLQQCSRNETVWTLTDDPAVAMQASCPVPFVSVQGEKRISAIDFLQVLAPNRLLLGSELGEVEIVEKGTGKLRHAPKFPGPVWLKTLAGFSVADRTEVWALDSGSRLYRWSSSQRNERFERVAEPLPDGAIPMSLSVAAEPLPAIGPARRQDESGYFSVLFPEGDEMTVERILVLGSDKRLYAWGALPPSDFAGLIPERGWVTHPPLPAEPPGRD